MQTKNLLLLQTKIAELRTALFFCDNEHSLSYAAHIIEVAMVDDQGCIWFSVNKYGGQSIVQDELFPVSLDFFRKGVPFTIYVKGTASIKEVTDDKLILKVTAGKLIYKDLSVATSAPVIESISKLFRNMFDIPEPLDEFSD